MIIICLIGGFVVGWIIGKATIKPKHIQDDDDDYSWNGGKKPDLQWPDDLSNF